MTSPRRVSNPTRRKRKRRKKKRKRKRRKRNPHLDQQNVQLVLNLVDLHSDKLPRQAEVAGRDQISLSMGKLEQHLQDQEPLSLLNERLDLEVLRQKPDQGVIHLMAELLRLNQEKVEECHHQVGTLVRPEHFHRVGKEVQYINHNIIDLLVVLPMGNARPQPHHLNQVLPIQTPIRRNGNLPLLLLPILNPVPKRRSLQHPMSLPSRIRLCNRKSFNGSRLNPTLALPCR